MTLQRIGGELIRLEANFEAEFSQNCVVMLEPVAGRVSQTFALLYGPVQKEQAEIDLDADEPAFEPLTGDAIDIGEAVAQELSLTLPEFPRLPDAVIEVSDTAEPDDNPFAALERLRSKAGLMRRAAAKDPLRVAAATFLAKTPLCDPPETSNRWPFQKRKLRHHAATCGARIIR